MRTVYQTSTVPGGFEIKLEQRADATFRVTYGKQVTDRLTYIQAAHELGQSILHSLACDGLIIEGDDPDEG